MEPPAATASWRKAYTGAQAVVASWRIPRQALLLDRAAAVREICFSGGRVVEHDMAPGNWIEGGSGEYPMPTA
jgi:hypothetical protein